MKSVSHPHNINYCNALSRGTATLDNDHKRLWLTRWKTKAPVTVPKFIPSFIGDSIVSTLMYLGVRRHTHHGTQVHFLRQLSLSQRRNFTLVFQV